MRVISLSRTVTAFAALALAAGCSDTTSPDFGEGSLPPAGGITIAPNGATLRPGQVVQFRAHLITASGDALAGSAVSWSSSNESVASVTERGEVFGRAEGHAVIIARADGKAAVATVHVLAGKKKIEPTMEPARRRP